MGPSPRLDPSARPQLCRRLRRPITTALLFGPSGSSQTRQGTRSSGARDRGNACRKRTRSPVPFGTVHCPTSVCVCVSRNPPIVNTAGVSSRFEHSVPRRGCLKPELLGNARACVRPRFVPVQITGAVRHVRSAGRGVLVPGRPVLLVRHFEFLRFFIGQFQAEGADCLR